MRPLNRLVGAAFGCRRRRFFFHKNAFRGTIHCSAEVAQHRWPSGFPSDAGHSMHRVNSILMQAPKIMIFETAANLELWPKILPHYRYIRFLERGHDRNLVVMAAPPSGLPITSLPPSI